MEKLGREVGIITEKNVGIDKEIILASAKSETDETVLSRLRCFF